MVGADGLRKTMKSLRQSSRVPGLLYRTRECHTLDCDLQLYTEHVPSHKDLNESEGDLYLHVVLTSSVVGR